MANHGHCLPVAFDEHFCFCIVENQTCPQRDQCSLLLKDFDRQEPSQFGSVLVGLGAILAQTNLSLMWWHTLLLLSPVASRLIFPSILLLATVNDDLKVFVR